MYVLEGKWASGESLDDRVDFVLHLDRSLRVLDSIDCYKRLTQINIWGADCHLLGTYVSPYINLATLAARVSQNVRYLRLYQLLG